MCLFVQSFFVTFVSLPLCPKLLLTYLTLQSLSRTTGIGALPVKSMQRAASSTSDRTIGDGSSNVNIHGNDHSFAHAHSAADSPSPLDKGDDKEQLADGGEKGEKGDRRPPSPVGFWDKSLKKTRLQVFRLWARTSKLVHSDLYRSADLCFQALILAIFILAILSLYWGVLFHVESNLNSLIVFVVDFDGQVSPYTGGTPLVGPMITQTTEAQVRDNIMPHLGWITVPPSAYNNDPIQVREAVFAQEAWAAIIVNANATALLRQAVEQGNSSYDPLGACQIIYVTARDQDSYYDYVIPQITQLQTEVSSKIGQMWTQQVMVNDSISRTNLQRVPQALSPAIGFSVFDLRPFYPYVAIPAVTIGLIYLIIIAFFSVFSSLLLFGLLLTCHSSHFSFQST